MRDFRRIYIRIVNYRKENIGDRSFMILLAIMVGVISAVAAMVLKTLIHFVEQDGIAILPSFISYFLFPLFGILLVVAIYSNVYKSAAGFHGIAGVLDAIRRRSSFIHHSLMYAQMVTSAITIGFGGSSGLESPTAVTGSAIGSNAARFFRMNYKFKTLFIGCGTAGTIAAIFNAPIAGVIFATEVILPQFSATIFIPILISSATGAFFADLFLGGDVLFKIGGVTQFKVQEFPLILVLGIFAGFVALFYTKLFAVIKEISVSISNKYNRAVIGGLILGSLIFLFPVLFGEGYIGLRAIIAGKSDVLLNKSILAPFGHDILNYILLFSLLIFVKPLAAIVTVHAGGEGGQFAPSFVTGGFVGYLFYLISVYLLPSSEILNPINYTLLGMAAVLAGVMHAPLTAIFLVAEITESYDLFIGLMLVTAIAFFIKYYFDPLAFHFKGLRTGAALEQKKMEFISLNNVITANYVDRNPVLLNHNDPVGKFINHYAESKIDVFGVINQRGELVGMITDHQIRKILLQPDFYVDKSLASIMTEPIAVVDIRDQMDLVVTKFDLYDVNYLPVMRKSKFIGFISRLDVLHCYREAMQKSGDLMS